jgi:hypothetical protein
VGATLYSKPPYRRLRVYALDPSLQQSLDTIDLLEATMQVPWEDLRPGPIGEYVEVIDVDPASECFYAPINLEDPALLAQDGLPPFEGDPQFHQQMAYAVVMRTIHNFERALGRKVLWSSHRETDEKGQPRGDELFVRRLRIYPHALREANAYYSPNKKALLFGYFNAQTNDPAQHLPGGLVFTCLSHDVVAHEATHAILDGQHPRLLRPTNPDVLAFHEAFADIVAIFQHFTMSDLLRHEIAKTRGDLASENVLAQLAIQFGRANSRRALRDALGEEDETTKKWQATVPDPSALDRITEPHGRGAILVAAVFDAFVMIYRRRTADLTRIASNGAGILAPGELHPDLVNRLADEAGRAAQHVLTVCIRAVDYLPPVDLTFGDYLRAIITSDYDLVRDDDLGYRVAFINAFSRRGIYPRDVRALAASSLLWQQPTPEAQAFLRRLLPDPRVLKRMVDDRGILEPPANWNSFPKEIMQQPLPLQLEGVVKHFLSLDESPPPGGVASKKIDRRVLFARSKLHAMLLHYFIKTNWQLIQKDYDEAQVSAWIGLALRKGESNKFEVHIVRPVHRVGPDGQLLEQLLVIITQRRRVTLDVNADNDGQAAAAPPRAAAAEEDDDEFGDPDAFADEAENLEVDFYGGCTLLIDASDGSVRYCILKNFSSSSRPDRQMNFLREQLEEAPTDATLQLALRGGGQREPLAMLHRMHSDGGEWT